MGWTEEGQYERFIQSKSGVDSDTIKIIDLHKNPTYNITESIIIWNGENYQGWTTSGQYERTLTSSAGCDSIVTTNLRVDSLHHVENISICEGEDYLGWISSGQYQRILESVSGIDSTIITNLWVQPSKKSTEYIVIKEGNNYKGWIESGEYKSVLTTTNGCDSTVTTILIVQQDSVEIAQQDSAESVNSYLNWSESGRYRRNDNLQKKSDFITFDNFEEDSIIKSSNIITENDFRLYPNPARSHIIVDYLHYPKLTTRIELIDSNGRKLFEKIAESTSNTINLHSFPSGLYYIRTINAQWNAVKKFMIE